MPILNNRRLGGYRAFPSFLDSNERVVLLPKKSLENFTPGFTPMDEDAKLSFRDFLALDSRSVADWPGRDPVGPPSPTSHFSMDSFIDKNYLNRTSDMQIIKEDQSIDPLEDSDDDDASVRSVSPSICATAVRVRITPLRAVRRSVRLSKVPPKDQRHFHWRQACKNVCNALQRKGELSTGDSSDMMDTNPDGNTASPSSINAYSLPSSLLPKLNLSGVEEKEDSSWEMINFVNHPGSLSTRQRPSAYRLHAPSIRRSASFSAFNSSSYNNADKDMDTEMTGLHAVTKEAAEMATMMSYRWKFEPAIIPPSYGEWGVTQAGSKRRCKPRRASH